LCVSEPQRRWRVVELVAFFVLFPASLWAARAGGWRVPVLPLLAATGLLAVLYLCLRAPGELRRAWRVQAGPELGRVALQTAAFGLALAAGVLLFAPERWLELPTRHPGRWAVLLALYPALSVVPQELVFRAYFFHRYGALLGNPARQALVSALVFGLAHAFYGHWLTVALSGLGGLCFAWTFLRTGSLALVVLEHSGYGLLLFTLGLGRLFLAEGP